MDGADYSLNDLAHRIGKDELARIIRIVDAVPWRLADAYARAMIRLRASQAVQHYELAMSAIEKYLATWLRGRGTMEELVERVADE